MARRRTGNNTITFSPFHSFQSFMNVNRNRFNIVKSGRRSGKTFFVTEDTSRFLINKDKRVGWFAPQSAYFKNTYEEIIRNLDPIIKTQNASDYIIKFINGAVIKFWSLENKDAGRGEKYHRVIIDEAGLTITRWENVYIDSILPTLTDYKGEMWLVGTPKGKNQFYDLWQEAQNDPEWSCFNATSYKNPYLDPAEIEKFKHRMPLKSFKQEFLAEFVDALEMNVISEELFDACLVDVGTLAEHKDYTICGYDVAEHGEDQNAVSIIKDNVLIYIDDWYGDNTISSIKNSVEKVNELCNDNNVSYMYFDAVGVGAGVGGYIPNDSKFNVVPFKASFKPAGFHEPYIEDISDPKEFISNGEQFGNRSAQAWIGLQMRMMNSYNYLDGDKSVDINECFFIDKDLPNLSRLRKELTQAVFSEETGKLLVDKKPAGKPSPNLADSVVMASSHWSYEYGLQRF